MPLKILYIEDSLDDIFLMRHFFKEYHPQVELQVFENGYQFLDFLASKNGDSLSGLNCIFLDINLPGLDGFEVLKAIKSCKNKYINSMPIIMFSSSYRQSDREKSKCFGAYDYIQKPFDFDGMQEALTPILTNTLQEFPDKIESLD